MRPNRDIQTIRLRYQPSLRLRDRLRLIIGGQLPTITEIDVTVHRYAKAANAGRGAGGRDQPAAGPTIIVNTDRVYGTTTDVERAVREGVENAEWYA